MPSPSDRPDATDSGRVLAFIDRWADPARPPEDVAAWRRMRVVVTVGLMALGAYALLGTSLVVGDAPLTPHLIVGAAVALTVLSLALVRWGGHVEAAARITTLMLAVVPVLQAGVDAGVRDPALALVAFAPLVAAMVSGAPLALLNTAVSVTGIAVLFAADRQGLTPAPFTEPEALDVYAAVAASMVSLLSALAGVLYVRHTRAALVEAEDESHRLDEALRESEARYRTLVDHVPVGIYRTAADGRILLANEMMAQMVGAESPEAACSMSAAAFYDDPADRDRFRRAIDRNGFVRRFETRWRRPDGQLRYVRVDSQATRDADGHLLYYEGMVEDVTAEREVREALYQSEARFRALVQRSSDVTVVVDRAAALTYVSPSVKALLGVPPDDLLGVPLSDLIHPEDRGHVEGFAAAAAAGGVATPAEIRMRHARGHYMYVEAVGTALYEDSTVGGLMLNLRDVTERKRAQAVLVQAKRHAEEIAALKSTFLANMSHEIRTPLTAILGFADVLADEVEDEAQQEFVGLITQSGRRLMDTLNSVLELARLESGRGELSQTRVDLGAIVREAGRMFGPVAAERGLTLEADVAPGSDVARGSLDAILDEAAVVRVVHNLLSNALKFTDEGGVSVSARTEAGGAHGPCVLVEVRDTGIGIDEAFLPKLFGEFEQESSGVGRTHEGVGLGLALSHQLVRRMGGTIRVESEKGVGTAFTVSFPAAGEVAAADDVRPLVLVVDDNEQARQVAERTLSEQFRVALASSGDEALAMVEAECPAAALLDIHLGQSINGEDVMRRLRQSEAFADLPIVAVTAYALPGDRERFLASGFDAYVTKPYTREHLIGAMRESIESRGTAGPVPEAPAPEAARAARPRALDGAAFVARPAESAPVTPAVPSLPADGDAA